MTERYWGTIVALFFVVVGTMMITKGEWALRTTRKYYDNHRWRRYIPYEEVLEPRQFLRNMRVFGWVLALVGSLVLIGIWLIDFPQ